MGGLRNILFVLLILFSSSSVFASQMEQENKKLVYLVSDIRILFWDIMSRGIQTEASKLGYSVEVLSANNSAKKELEHTVKAIHSEVDGIIVSPTNSSACVTILKLAKKANIPVVISDIGTDGGEYLSYISSDNESGAYAIGQILAKKMKALNVNDGSVGIIAIPQKRANGKARTKGFMRAMHEASIKGSELKQQIDFSHNETYNYTKELIVKNPDLKAIWLQGSDRYQGALDAMKDMGKQNDILLITFDAEPIFLDLIPQGVLIGAGMQQPYLMGSRSVVALDDHFNGKVVQKEMKLPVLAISKDNIEVKLSTIKRNVLGIEK